MWSMILVAAASAGDDFEVVRSSGGCEISMRPKAPGRPVAMRADCNWPEVDPAKMTDLVSQFERYPDFIFPIDVSEVRRQGASGEALVYQRQEMFGISDREVLLWMARGEVTGGSRVSWRAATEEPLTLRKRAIRTPMNTGYWEITVRPEGGARVVHEIAMDAGGSIPEWLKRMVRTRGFARVMSEVRERAAAE